MFSVGSVQHLSQLVRLGNLHQDLGHPRLTDSGAMEEGGLNGSAANTHTAIPTQPSLSSTPRKV